MPATYTFKPIEANLTHNTELIGRMNPYCSFIVNGSRIKGQVCKKGGKYPQWNDAITIPATANESKILVEVMDKDKITHDDNVGSFMLDLQEVKSRGQVAKWYPLYHKNKTAGEIFMEVVFQPDVSSMTPANNFYQEEQYRTAQPAMIKQENTTGTVFTEQKQIVEPHTFMKEVEVIETRPAVKEIEVMEPVKVIKDVQVTEAVPVKKQIEVVEPQVVTKEVEVMEPKLVTKTIQVVENVPVTKKVEVVEMKNTVQEVETVEPQTFTKQVEVTEYVPSRKEVQVTQPVAVKKAVEFVEPVITTQTVTKEVKEPVVVGEKITTAVGPATVVDMKEEYREGGYLHSHKNDVRTNLMDENANRFGSNSNF